MTYSRTTDSWVIMGFGICRLRFRLVVVHSPAHSLPDSMHMNTSLADLVQRRGLR